MSIKISHFSDILCIWAYVAQARVDEIVAEFGVQVEVDFHLFSVFGDVPQKVVTQWEHRGGIQAYNKHVQEVAEKFDHIELHPDVWVQNQALSSAPAHLYLSAVAGLIELSELEKDSYQRFTKLLRKAFFVDAMDISRSDILSSLIEHLTLPINKVQEEINSGRAYARLCRDINLAKELNVKVSPTFLFNEDRQRLTGNVGYKIIQANIKELIERPVDSGSWC